MLEYLMFRPVRIDDLDDVFHLSLKAQFGLSTLPKDKQMLEDIILKSETSFSNRNPRNELYLFVLEDIRQNKVVGTSGIQGEVGVDDDFFVYKRIHKHVSDSFLKKEKKTVELHLQNNPIKSSKLGTLYLDPEYRSYGVGRFLSIARLSFIANHRSWFKDSIITELRGVSDELGHSPFWDHVMKPFFNVSFYEAGVMAQTSDTFIGSCIPRIPLLVDIMPTHIQDIIGKTHPYTIPAMKILQSEGFEMIDLIDIFDGGPKMRALTDHIKAVRRTVFSSRYTLTGTLENKNLYIFSSGRGDSFRSCCSQGVEDKDQNTICVHDEPALQHVLKQGELLSYLRLYPKSRRSYQYTAPVSYSLQGLSQTPFLACFSQWFQELSRCQSSLFYR
ncbi:arginine N-succinyltransferase [Candidatus Marinamargulisbacteria bacterium SCGC AG-343-D04]|nr:arginine N-succinyltransferase [Candidatus Marinamargulisbacteria bacterium SCGC AG-343-D04]